MTDERTREQKVEDLLDLYIDVQTDEDREALELFNALPDEVKIAALFVHNPEFRKRASDLIWGINEDSHKEDS